MLIILNILARMKYGLYVFITRLISKINVFNEHFMSIEVSF